MMTSDDFSLNRRLYQGILPGNLHQQVHSMDTDSPLKVKVGLCVWGQVRTAAAGPKFCYHSFQEKPLPLALQNL